MTTKWRIWGVTDRRWARDHGSGRVLIEPYVSVSTWLDPREKVNLEYWLGARLGADDEVGGFELAYI